MLAAVVLSLTGVINFLIVVAILALLVVGLRWLFGKMGWALPEPMWAIVGFIVLLLVILWAFGGGPGITLR